MTSDDQVKIGDFGLATLVESNRAADGETSDDSTFGLLTKGCGTELYTAPEILVEKGFHSFTLRYSYTFFFYV